MSSNYRPVSNGSAQRELEKAKNDADAQLEQYKTAAQLSVEETKSESARILEILKTADPDKAATNFEFPLKAGLIANENRRHALSVFLEERKPGQGPTLSLNAPPGALPKYFSFTQRCNLKSEVSNPSDVMAALQRYGSNAKSPYELAPGAPAPKPADRVIFVEVRSKATRSVLLNLEILVGSGVVTVSSRNSAPETFDSVIGSLREIVADSRCPEVRVVEGIETPGEFAKAISRNL